MNENQIIGSTLEMLFKNIKFEGRFQHMLDMANSGIDGELIFLAPIDLPAFAVHIKKELRQYQIPQLREMAGKHKNFMVMAETIFPSIKEQLRTHNINHVDAAGNIYIKTPQQTIWIDGNKLKPQKNTGTNKAFTKTGLKTVFYLLINEEAINYSYRKLAQAADVALGNIKNVLDGLKEAGYVLPLAKKRNKLQNKKTLLERWVTAYGETLRPALYIGSYNFWDKDNLRTWNKLPFEAGETTWGGEPGGDILTNHLVPEILTLYTNEKTKLVTKWKLIPSEAGVLKIYKKFWKDEVIDHHPYAPPLLVYTDLILANDPRCVETANIIYDKYLRHEFEGDQGG